MGSDTARIVTLNIWQEQGHWPKRLNLIAARLKPMRPDVLCLQEVRQVPAKVPNQAEILAEKLGMHCRFETVESWGGGEEGLAVLSRGEPVETRYSDLPTSEGRSKRKVLGVALDFGATRAWFFTTHLAYRPADGLLREAQVCAVDQFIGNCRNEDVAVLAGDFNAVPESDEIRFLMGQTTLAGHRTYYQDAFGSQHPGEAGITWASANPYTKPLAWLGLDRRLDYIFVTAMRRSGAGNIENCRVILEKPNDEGLLCSDHYGLCADVALGPSPPTTG